MNIFNKTVLALSLVLAIPLSIQANWLSDSLVAKKKTIAASTILGSALSYGSVKLVNRWYDKFKTTRTQALEQLEQSKDPKFIPSLTEYVKTMQRKKTVRALSVLSALGTTAGLIGIAHKLNVFGEKA